MAEQYHYYGTNFLAALFAVELSHQSELKLAAYNITTVKYPRLNIHVAAHLELSFHLPKPRTSISDVFPGASSISRTAFRERKGKDHPPN